MTHANLKLEDVLAARARNKRFVHKTPLLRSETLSNELGCEVHIKCEFLQKTGSFKARGALNFLAMNGTFEHYTTYSSGNHGQALAWAAKQKGRKATIFMPEDASPAKVAAVRGYGGDVQFAGLSSGDRMAACESWAADGKAKVVPPYDHRDIVAGQGTVMVEILEDLPHFDAVLIPAGGGGLLAGNSLVLEQLRRQVDIYACEPKAADDANRSIASGELVSMEYPITIADGLRNLCMGDLNWSIISRAVQGGLTCTEEGIKAAMISYASRLKQVVEPSGAVTLACLREHHAQFAGKTVVLIASGGNIAMRDYAGMVGNGSDS